MDTNYTDMTVNVELLYEYLDHSPATLARAAVELVHDRLEDAALIKLLTHLMLLPEEARREMDLPTVEATW